jgi:shikimate dehydrogenase
MKRYGLIGYPLSHSFSKKYFEDKFQREGIADCAYELFSIASIDELSGLLSAHPDLKGLNVTIPYKQLVLPYLTDISHLPERLLACNCIKIEDGALTGYNTDFTGFEKSFTPKLQSHHTKALLLGSGGAAAAVAYVLRKSGIAYKLVSRTPGNGDALTYDEVDEAVIASHPVIINTTPLGMYPHVNEAPQLPYNAITPKHYLFDLHYNPAKTVFLQKGEERGAAIKNGQEMLVLQAEESWRIWND